METERLQKILARAGYGSRRACEELIAAGRVKVDGQVAQLGDSANPAEQRITVDGELIRRPEPYVYVMLHKPRGYISTTRDPHGRRTVLDLVTLPPQQRATRLYPVGRLDYESEGLLLLTNDGRLTHRLTHPSYEHPRVYRVLVEGKPEDAILERWRRGITLDGRLTRMDAVQVEAGPASHDTTWLRVTVHEGRKHLVRRMAAALGHPVERLVRVEMGPLKLGELESGRWRFLSASEIGALQQEVGLARAGRERDRSRSRQRRGSQRPGSQHRRSQRRGSQKKSRGRKR